MKFLLNLGFILGDPKSKDRIEAEEPSHGQLTVGGWPPAPIKRPSRFRLVAEFKIPQNPQLPQILYLYDPKLVRATENYIELVGFERIDRAFYMQSWILRSRPQDDGARQPFET